MMHIAASFSAPLDSKDGCRRKRRADCFTRTRNDSSDSRLDCSRMAFGHRREGGHVTHAKPTSTFLWSNVASVAQSHASPLRFDVEIKSTDAHGHALAAGTRKLELQAHDPSEVATWVAAIRGPHVESVVKAGRLSAAMNPSAPSLAERITQCVAQRIVGTIGHGRPATATKAHCGASATATAAGSGNEVASSSSADAGTLSPVSALVFGVAESPLAAVVKVAEHQEEQKLQEAAHPVHADEKLCGGRRAARRSHCTRTAAGSRLVSEHRTTRRWSGPSRHASIRRASKRWMRQMQRQRTKQRWRRHDRNSRGQDWIHARLQEPWPQRTRVKWTIRKRRRAMLQQRQPQWRRVRRPNNDDCSICSSIRRRPPPLSPASTSICRTMRPLESRRSIASPPRQCRGGAKHAAIVHQQRIWIPSWPATPLTPPSLACGHGRGESSARVGPHRRGGASRRRTAGSAGKPRC